MFENSFDHIELHVQVIEWCLVPARLRGGPQCSGRADVLYVFLMDMCRNAKSNAIFGHVWRELVSTWNIILWYQSKHV